MTVTTPLAVAVRDAVYDYRRFDRYRDRHWQRTRVQRLASTGMPTADIAADTNMSTETVQRIIRGDIDPTHRPEPVTPPNLSEEHCEHLERTADHALKLACRLRDDDPQIVWDALSRLDRHQLQELAVVLLAAVPVDHTRKQIFGWVQQLGNSIGQGLAPLTAGGNQ